MRDGHRLTGRIGARTKPDEIDMRFFFDTQDGERSFTDRTGTDLPGEGDAIEQALDLLRDLSHGPVSPGMPRALSVQVRGEGGEGLYAATLHLRVDRLG